MINALYLLCIHTSRRYKCQIKIIPNKTNYLVYEYLFHFECLLRNYSSGSLQLTFLFVCLVFFVCINICIYMIKCSIEEISMHFLCINSLDDRIRSNKERLGPMSSQRLPLEYQHEYRSISMACLDRHRLHCQRYQFRYVSRYRTRRFLLHAN